MIRIFYKSDISPKSSAILEGNDHHYVKNVMRLGEGGKLLIFNQNQGEWLAEIEQISKKNTVLNILSQNRDVSLLDKGYKATIFFAPIKSSRQDFLIEKTTEIGVDIIQPVRTERTVISKINKDKLWLNAKEASEQCGRLDVPIVNDLVPLRDAIDQFEGQIYFCDEHKAGLVTENSKAAGNIGFVIGPEGGFSEKERDYLLKKQNVTAISLGSNILRAETAAIACLSRFLL